MNNQNVKPVETAFVMTHALRQCRRKVFKKGGGFANDKLTTDERDQFTNCLGKYFDVSSYSIDALRAGLIDIL
jgi:hypothetical protein